MTDIPKAYEPGRVEEKWYRYWLDQGYFTANPSSAKPAYSIVIPPPNVTGVLTMGHVLNNTLQDILARRKRMQGYEVLWLPGTDHAGIATQTAVEKHLRKQKVIRHRDELGREKFLEKVWEWKDKHGGIIIQQLKKLGCSCDWSRERFTMDEAYSHCVLQVFVDLYRKGLIYRGKRMVNWCPVSRTALSDEEVIMKEVDGHLWHIRYPLLDHRGQPQPDQFLVVATTRPETMLGDEAVAVNPNDGRYRHLIGRHVLLPLQNKRIPIVADAAVDPQFGTGCVKVTPAHDPADYEMALRHKLPFTQVIGPDGTMTEEAGEPFEGLDRMEARDAVVKELEEDGLLAKVEPYKHNVGFSERADVPVEPMISEQWFLRYPSTEQSRAAVADGQIQFHPERWAKVYDHWLANLRDWCISRQLWWGHRIPVWYCVGDQACRPECKQPIVQIEPPVACPHCGSRNLRQDEDVLDTWFSSWLWPFATMGWPQPTETLKKFYPTTDLVTGPDIIFFWVARMIMAGYEFTGQKPFSHVYFTGIIRDAIGRKMSKSLGNSPDPLDLIARYGADGLRFGLMLIAPQGQDILFDEKRCEIGRNFMNKVWNAARFLQLQRAARPPAAEYNIHDRKILFELNETVTRINAALDGYRFNEAARELYDFVWSDFCDWYIEISKASPNLPVLEHVFHVVLRLLHPFAPFLTEELWHGLGFEGDTIQFAPWPTTLHPEAADAALAARVDALYEVVRAGRQLRNDYKIEPQRKLHFALKPATDVEFFRTSLAVLKNLLGAEQVDIDPAYQPRGLAPSMVTSTAVIYMVGAVDVATERARLSKELERARKDLQAVEAKLATDSFRDRAPVHVVQAQQQRRTETLERIRQLETALAALG